MRFTSPDPLLASGVAGNPQTWNRYAYVGNNPVKNTDPLGLCSAEYSSCDEPYARDGISNPNWTRSSERQRGLDAYNQRLQNQYDVIAANRAARNGDMETFWDIVNGNENLSVAGAAKPEITVDSIALLDGTKDDSAVVAKGSSDIRIGTDSPDDFVLDVNQGTRDPTAEMFTIAVTFSITGNAQWDSRKIHLRLQIGTSKSRVIER